MIKAPKYFETPQKKTHKQTECRQSSHLAPPVMAKSMGSRDITRLWILVAEASWAGIAYPCQASELSQQEVHSPGTHRAKAKSEPSFCPGTADENSEGPCGRSPLPRIPLGFRNSNSGASQGLWPRALTQAHKGYLDFSTQPSDLGGEIIRWPWGKATWGYPQA